MTTLQEKRRALCRTILREYAGFEDRYWEVLDSLGIDKIDGHDSADQFLIHYARKLDEITLLMDEYRACFDEEE